MAEFEQLGEDQLHHPNTTAPQEQYRKKSARRVDLKTFDANLVEALGPWCRQCRRCHHGDQHYATATT